jgi:hypothetical protein
MGSRKPGSLTADHPLAVNLLVLLLLVAFALFCAMAALKGLDGVQKHERGDLMSPIWFVASAMGALTSALLFVAMLASLAGDAMARRRRTRRLR